MNRRFLAATPLALGVVAAAAGCHSGSGAGAPLPTASYTAQASAAASAAGEVATRCEPKGESIQAWEAKMLLVKGTLKAFYTCEKIPKGDDAAVAACALTAAENAHKAAGTSASKETSFIAALASCVSSLGATPSASASVSR